MDLEAVDCCEAGEGRGRASEDDWTRTEEVWAMRRKERTRGREVGTSRWAGGEDVGVPSTKQQRCASWEIRGTRFPPFLKNKFSSDESLFK